MRTILTLTLFIVSFIPTPGVSAPTIPAPAARCAPPVASPFRFETITRSGAVHFVATISVNCPGNLPFTLVLTSTQGCALTTSSGRIAYGLFLDSSYRQPALNCEPGEQIVLTGEGYQSFEIYGVAIVNDRMSLPATNYNDPITVRLTF